MNYSVIIPTYNEEIHLDRVLKQMNFYKIKCFILDSYSNDNTLKIAEKYGVQVVQGKWNDFSEKLNFGIELNPFKTEWMIRLDADEYLDQDFINFLNQGSIHSDHDGIYVRRKIHFMGKWIKYGGMYPNYIIRIFKPKKTKYEHKILDEQIIDLKKWINKHIRYAEIYSIGYFSDSYSSSIKHYKGLSRIKIILQNLYLNIPLFIRPFLYFFYRYFIQMGFLDGKKGLIFHVMHAFWYRFFIDALIYQEKNYMAKYSIEKNII